MKHWIRAMVVSMSLGAAAGGAAAAGGSTVVIGGALRDDNAAVWTRIVALAGGPGVANFAVFGTAADDPDASAGRIVATLERYGAKAEHVRVAPRIEGLDLAAAVRDPRWIERVKGARGVFFSGGDQDRLIDTLRPRGVDTPLLAAVRALHANGGVVAGTSAGAAVMSDMAIRDIGSPIATLKGAPLRQGRELDRGFAFLPAGVVADQHFIKRGRIGRLLPVLAATAQPLGLGVEEDSAAIVRGDEVEVVGARGVMVVDMRGAKVHTQAPFAASGVRLTWLQSGDRIVLDKTLAVSSAPSRAQRTIEPNRAGFRGYYSGDVFVADILAEGAIVGAMQRVIDGDRRELRGLAFDALASDGAGDAALGFEWKLAVGPASRGWVGKTSSEVSVADVLLDITPVRMARPLYGPWLPR